jgi:hypothetical protein
MITTEIYNLAEKYGRNIDKYYDGSAAFTINGYRMLFESLGNGFMIYHYTKGKSNRYFSNLKEAEAYLKEVSR